MKLSTGPTRKFPLPSARSKEGPYYQLYDDVPIAAGKPKSETNSKHKMIGMEIGTDEVNPDITKRQGSKLIICPRSFERENIISKTFPGLKKFWNLGIIQQFGPRLNYIPWILSISLILISVLLIIIYGITFGVDKSLAFFRTNLLAMLLTVGKL